MNSSRLVRAVVILWVLYASLAIGAFMLLPADALKAMYETMPRFMQIQAAPDVSGFTAQAAWQRFMVVMWSAPVFLSWILMMLVGSVVASLAVMAVGDRYRKRLAGSQRWMGAKTSIGPLLKPQLPYRIHDVSVDLDLKNVKLTKPQQAFVDQALGLIKARPDTFAGDGHAVGLYEHTLNVLERAVSQDDCDALLIMAAAVHDLGKLTSYKKVGQQHQKIREHGVESGRLMRLLPAYEQLIPADAEAVFLAVRYEHYPDLMPRGTRQAVLDLRDQLAKVDGLATETEKHEELSKRDPQQELLDAFDTHFGEMPFYRKGLARGAKTVGQRKGRRLFFNEHAFREWLQWRVDRDLSAALGRIRKGGEVSALTQNLLTALHKRGWLVSEIEVQGKIISLPPEIAIWSGQSGTMPYNGVFIVRIPEDAGLVLPEAAPFPVQMQRPATPGLDARATTRSKNGDQPESDAKPETMGGTGERFDAAQVKPKKRKHQGRTASQSKQYHSTPASDTDEGKPKHVLGPWGDAELAVIKHHADMPRKKQIAIIVEQTGRSYNAVARKLDKLARAKRKTQGKSAKLEKPKANTPITDPRYLLEYLPQPNSGGWSDEEVAILQEHAEQGATAVFAIAKATGRSQRSVERKLKQYNKEVMPFV